MLVVMRLCPTLARRMIQAALLVVTLFSPVVSVLSSSADHQRTEGICTIDSVTREAGWALPSLKAMKAAPPMSMSPQGHSGSVSTFIVYSPVKEVLYRADYFELQPDGAMIVRTQEFKVSSVHVFSIQGKAYALGLDLVGRHFNPKTGAGGFGGQAAFVFYDDNNDGVYETRESSSQPIPRRLPHWAAGGSGPRAGA